MRRWRLVERAQNGVARTFLLAGALILLIALIASYLAGAHVSAPLRQMALVAARVDGGELGPRMESDGSRAGEIQVLAESFNTMLDRLSEAFAAQREFVADASHELRTPLTVIRGQLEVLAAEAEPSVAEVQRVEHLVQAEVSRISRLVDDLLLLAQSERMDFLRMQSVELEPFITDLWEGLSHTADRRFELGPVPTGTLRPTPTGSPRRVRNLVRNAIEHTAPGTGQVRLEVQRGVRPRGAPGRRRRRPGDPRPPSASGCSSAFTAPMPRGRGPRGAPGSGLAIVQAIVEAHGGQARARVGQRLGRGARSSSTLPRFVRVSAGRRPGSATLRRDEALPRDHVRLSDERARFRAHARDARVDRLCRGAGRATRPI